MRLRRKQTLMDRASEFAETVIPQIESALESALETGKESAREAQAKAAPLIAHGRQVATEVATEAAAVAAEKASVGATIAAEKAQVGAALAAQKAGIASDFAAAKAVELRARQAPPEKEGGGLRKLLLIGALLALGAFVVNKMRGSGQESWQTSYTPAPPPSSATGTSSTSTFGAASGAAGAHSAGTDTTDDVGGGTPGEAVADAVEEPRAATTPDDPATIIDVDDVPGEHTDRG